MQHYSERIATTWLFLLPAPVSTKPNCTFCSSTMLVWRSKWAICLELNFKLALKGFRRDRLNWLAIKEVTFTFLKATYALKYKLICPLEGYLCCSDTLIAQFWVLLDVSCCPHLYCRQESKQRHFWELKSVESLKYPEIL